MSRAGYDIGTKLGEMEARTYTSKTARIVALVGRIIGRILLVIGALGAFALYAGKAFTGNMNNGLFWLFFFVAVIGVVIEVAAYCIAVQIQKKHTPQSTEE